MYPYRKLGQKLTSNRGLPWWTRLFPLLQHKHRSSYLSQTGWHNSIAAGFSIDAQHKPLPWYTYPAIDFLRPLLAQNGKSWHVYEYGCGNSTLWWAEHTQSVTAQEHDAKWRAHISKNLPQNAQIFTATTSDKINYANTICKAQQKFHIIVIDSKNRNTCAKVAPEHLTPDGIIIWDDSERVSNKQGLKYLRNYGFKALHFIGLGPLHAQPSRTTIFYRPDNILDI